MNPKRIFAIVLTVASPTLAFSTWGHAQQGVATDPSTKPAQRDGGDHGNGQDPLTGPAYRGPTKPTEQKPSVLPVIKNTMLVEGGIVLQPSVDNLAKYALVDSLPVKGAIAHRDRDALAASIRDGSANWQDVFNGNSNGSERESPAARFYGNYTLGTTYLGASDMTEVTQGMRLSLKVKVNARLADCLLCNDSDFLPIPPAGIQFEVECGLESRSGYSERYDTFRLPGLITITSKHDAFERTIELGSAAEHMRLRYCQGAKAPAEFVARLSCKLVPATARDNSLFAASFEGTEYRTNKFGIADRKFGFINDTGALGHPIVDASSVGFTVTGTTKLHVNAYEENAKRYKEHIVTEYSFSPNVGGRPITGGVALRYHSMQELKDMMNAAATAALDY